MTDQNQKSNPGCACRECFERTLEALHRSTRNLLLGSWPLPEWWTAQQVGIVREMLSSDGIWWTFAERVAWLDRLEECMAKEPAPHSRRAEAEVLYGQRVTLYVEYLERLSECCLEDADEWALEARICRSTLPAAAVAGTRAN